MENKIILGIETSCDDTSLCLLEGIPSNKDQAHFPSILAFLSFSQEKLLSKWGGVVPEIASRNHLEKIKPLLEELFKEGNISLNKIDLIAVTTHPGLLGPLLTGINAAKTISLLYKTPILPVNHLYAHLEAIHLSEKITYPYLGLLVSGGHSLYSIVSSPVKFDIIGSTIDDAAGEAFDKGGKLLGLEYPGGKIVDQRSTLGDKNRYQFPIGLKNSKDTRLSFSGVKTSLRTLITKDPSLLKNEQCINDICASYQKAIVDALLLKLTFAYENAKKLSSNNHIPIVVGGGVACNSYLRTELKEKFNNAFFVSPQYCTDNGAMIANYALSNIDNMIPYPLSLNLDVKGKFIKKVTV